MPQRNALFETTLASAADFDMELRKQPIDHSLCLQAETYGKDSQAMNATRSVDPRQSTESSETWPSLATTKKHFSNRSVHFDNVIPNYDNVEGRAEPF